jgi:predicted RND superfamily exporter protein
MLGMTVVLLGLVAILVDLKPVVDENFFFSTNDPQFQQSRKIEQRFPSQPEVILAVSSQDITSPRYLGRIQKLTQQINTIEQVSAVKSLAEGPKSFKDALASPFWSRLLIAPDRKSSNVIAFIEGKDPEKPIKRLEQIMHELDERDFRIHIAGPPYVVEMIRRSLAHDFGYFSLTAVVLFGLTMAAMFRSGRVFLGMLTTCTSAVLLTLLLQSMFGKKIGILTVNLGTIVFVVALSHLVYMTFNWQTLADRMGKKSADLAAAARRMTFPASFWSMVCASLGFGSLLIVQAKPLRELGFGGVLGTVVALICAYVMYPSFLRWAVPRKSKLVEAEPSPEILVAPLRAAIDRRHSRQRRPGIRPKTGEHRSELSRLFQAAPGTARRIGIRGPQRRLEPADPGGGRSGRQQPEHRRCLPEDVDAARSAGKLQTGGDSNFPSNSTGGGRPDAVLLFPELRENH